MRTERKSPISRYWPVTALVAAGVAGGTWHNTQVRHDRQDYIAETVRAIITAPASVLERSTHWIGAQTGWVLKGRSLMAENERLARRVAELEAENARLREAQIRYDRLRSDLNFVRSIERPPLAAEVWCRRPDPKYDTLIISRGSRDGVKPHDLVICPQGVV